MNVLVTGGAGYIGSVLVGKLLRGGHKVTVLDRLMFRAGSLLAYCNEPHFNFVHGDARDEGTLKSLLKDKDAIIPLAAIVGMPACQRDPITATSTNLDAIVLLNRLRSPAQRVIYPCTNSGYGTKSGEVHCTEETPMEPISLYGRTKADAEKCVLDSSNALTFRFATIFGVSPRMRVDLLVNDFTYRALRDRFLVLYEHHFKRNYLHIEDAADVFVFALEHFEQMKGQTYNVGLDDANLSKLELAEKIKQHVPALYIHCAEIGSDPDKRNYIISNARIRSKGFAATRSLDLGIRQLMIAFQMLPPDELYNA